MPRCANSCVITWTEPTAAALSYCEWLVEVEPELNSDGAAEDFRVTDVQGCVLYPLGTKQGEDVLIVDNRSDAICRAVEAAMKVELVDTLKLIAKSQAEWIKANAEIATARNASRLMGRTFDALSSIGVGVCLR